MSGNDSSSTGANTAPMTPMEAITWSLRGIETLKLSATRYFTESEWRAHYVGTIRMYAGMLAEEAEQMRTRRDRAVSELNGLYYMTTIAFQIAKIVSMDEEPQIIPQMHYEHGLKFIVFGDDVVAEVLFREDGRIFLTLRNNISGIEPVTVELGDEGLTPVAAFLVASVYMSPLTPSTTPKHLRWMWDPESIPGLTTLLREHGIDTCIYDILVVPHPQGVFVEVLPHG